MKKVFSLLLALCLLLTFAQAAVAEAGDAADIVVTGRIYTANKDALWAEAFAVREGKFVYVGDAAGAQAYIGEGTQVVELGEGMATPNLLDAHSHPGIVGTTAWHDRMGSLYTLEEILEHIGAYLSEHSAEDEPFVYFEYYPSDLFGTDGPRKEILDEIAPDRPILVRDFSDHASWLNSKALELLGVYEDVEGAAEAGFVQDETGDFTGWVKEFGFNYYEQNLWDALNWTPADSATEETISIVTDDMKAWGVTGIMDAYVLGEDHVKAVHDMDEKGELNMYYELSVVMDDYSALEECLAAIHYFDETYGTKHVSIDTLKIFYDGTNELGDSALIDGTVDDPDNHGFMLLDYQQTKDSIRRCNEEGIDIHFHMVGDLAFRTVCDATEELIAENGPLDIQVELTHCEYVDAADMVRPAQLGILVNWTPHWSGGYFGDGSMLYLGEERYNNMYQFNTMIESGAIVTFGSDIYSMNEENRGNPYFGMQTAMTRVDIEYPLDTPDHMRPSENAKLSLDNLLAGYTINAAIQMRIDETTGSIEAGKDANFNLYGVNLFDVPETEMKDVLPTAVVFEGNVLGGALQ